MRVKFKSKWFGPSEPYNHTDKRVFKGTVFEKGVIYDIDPDMRDHLPRSAEVLDEEFIDPVEEVREAPEVKEVDEETLRDFDANRAADDELTKALEEAEANASEVTPNRKKK